MGMKLRTVDSSMLLAVGYDENARELRVIFRSGDTYRYLNVPPSTYAEFLKAESKGAYMKTHVIDVYPSRRVWFVDEDDKYGFRKFEPIAKDVLRLYDYVRFHWKEKYNAADESGKPGGRKEAKVRKRGARRLSTYYFLEPDKGPVQGDVPIEKGLALPLISGFRVLIQEKNGKFEWLADPFKFFDMWGTKLARTIMNASELAGGDPILAGRDPQNYRQMTSEVRRWYLEGELAKRNGSNK